MGYDSVPEHLGNNSDELRSHGNVMHGNRRENYGSSVCVLVIDRRRQIHTHLVTQKCEVERSVGVFEVSRLRWI